jgi:excisionase family DNA binding protein
LNWFQFVSIREKGAVAGNEIEESYLTVAEVAQTLKLNQQTVRNWIDAGTLPALRVGRRVRIKRSDFERILEESYSGSANGSGESAGRAQATADDFWGGGSVGLAEPGHDDGELESPVAPGRGAGL